VGIDYR
jgi:hypothetical protein